MIERIKILIYGAFAYLGIEIESFSILMFLMVLDSTLGALKAIRLGREFRFKKLLWGIILKLCFLIIPLIIALLGKSLDYDLRHGVSIVISILLVSEAYSILGNIYSVKNKIEVDRVDFVSQLLKTLRATMGRALKALIKKVED